MLTLRIPAPFNYCVSFGIVSFLYSSARPNMSDRKRKPSDRYKHAVNSKQRAAGGRGPPRAGKGRPGAKARSTAGQSKVASRLKQGSSGSNKKKGGSTRSKGKKGRGNGGNKKALPKRMEKKKVQKQTFFGSLQCPKSYGHMQPKPKFVACWRKFKKPPKIQFLGSRGGAFLH